MPDQTQTPSGSDATAAAPQTSVEPPAPSDQTGTGTDEIGGPAGPEPTRFGDWEKAGRCSDF